MRCDKCAKRPRKTQSSSYQTRIHVSIDDCKVRICYSDRDFNLKKDSQPYLPYYPHSKVQKAKRDICLSMKSYEIPPLSHSNRRARCLPRNDVLNQMDRSTLDDRDYPAPETQKSPRWACGCTAPGGPKSSPANRAWLSTIAHKTRGLAMKCCPLGTLSPADNSTPRGGLPLCPSLSEQPSCAMRHSEAVLQHS